MPRIKTTADDGSIRARAFVIAFAIAPASQYWVASTWNGFTIMSLFINAIFVVFVLAGSNRLVARWSPEAALRPGELLLIYAVLAASTAAVGHDTIEMLTQVIGYPAHFASPENEWETILFRHLPRWLFVWDKNIVAGLYHNGETFFARRTIAAFVRPLAYWSAFLVALYTAMVCLDLLLRRQWTDRERLAFPVAQIPLGVMRSGGEVFGSGRFWIGFAGAAALSLLNGLHQLYPSVPGLTYGKFDLGALFTEAPWNAIDAAYVEFLPFVFGLAYFIPVELSFSIWFFYWFWKVIAVAGRAAGLHRIPGFPGFWSQGMGGMMLMGAMFLWWARHHIGAVVRDVLRGRRSSDDDSPYRFAVVGFVVSAMFLVGFLAFAGMAVWVGVLFLGSYFVMSIVTTRLRAQVGPPTHELPFTASGMLTSFLGVRSLPAGSLAGFAVFRFVDFGQRGTPMPQVLESLYLRDRLQSRSAGRFVAAIVAALVIGTLVGFVGNLQRSYVYSVQTWVGDWAFPQVASQLQYRPTGVDLAYIVYFVIGGAMVLLLGILGRTFFWWQLHPLGYIMGGEWMLRHLWFPIFLAWAVRWTLLRFAGIAGHRKTVPLFLGVTLGDATMLGLWSLYGTIFREWTISYVYW
ncbi:hypothetical protein FJZ36_07230 [Candidatus Poribacteria bacterium]|nr:hypothetical protein [Candidatus Poribacteria bacterium]